MSLSNAAMSNIRAVEMLISGSDQTALREFKLGLSTVKQALAPENQPTTTATEFSERLKSNTNSAATPTATTRSMITPLHISGMKSDNASFIYSYLLTTSIDTANDGGLIVDNTNNKYNDILTCAIVWNMAILYHRNAIARNCSRLCQRALSLYNNCVRLARVSASTVPELRMMLIAGLNNMAQLSHSNGDYKVSRQRLLDMSNELLRSKQQQQQLQEEQSPLAWSDATLQGFWLNILMLKEPIAAEAA